MLRCTYNFSARARRLKKHRKRYFGMWKTNVEESLVHKDFHYVVIVNYIKDLFICRKQERKCLEVQVMPCKTQDSLKSPMLVTDKKS